LSAAGEPNNLTEALEDTNWKHAMDEEYTALMDNKTWHLVPLAPTRISLTASGFIE
jgi:histone deacetylase 1/2